jgi:hypothetical protein
VVAPSKHIHRAPVGGHEDVLVGEAPEGDVELGAHNAPHLTRQRPAHIIHQLLPAHAPGARPGRFAVAAARRVKTCDIVQMWASNYGTSYRPGIKHSSGTETRQCMQMLTFVEAV